MLIGPLAGDTIAAVIVVVPVNGVYDAGVTVIVEVQVVKGLVTVTTGGLYAIELSGE